MPSLSNREALAKATGVLRLQGLETARLDAEVILAFVLQTSRPDLYLKSEDIIPAGAAKEYFSMVNRRLKREPVAYITGEKEFMSLGFKVNRNVLIPRPDTEIMVAEALVIKPLRIIDVGTGSGAVAVSLAYYLPDCEVLAIDISPAALEAARFNAARHGMSDRISFVQGNLLDPLGSTELNSRFDVITANLPYIPSPEMDNLPVDVRGYEPLGALDGGPDGLDCYREMCPRAMELLKKGGVLLFEVGYDQAVIMRSYMNGLGYSNIETIRDLSGLDRIIKVFRS